MATINPMTDPANRIADLSPKKRELLLQRLRAQKGQGAARTGIPALPRTGNTFPLSFAQERLWFLQQLQPGTAIYNNPELLRLEGQLNLDHFNWSGNEIVRRHENFRTTFSVPKV